MRTIHAINGVVQQLPYSERFWAGYTVQESTPRSYGGYSAALESEHDSLYSAITAAYEHAITERGKLFTIVGNVPDSVAIQKWGPALSASILANTIRVLPKHICLDYDSFFSDVEDSF